MDKVQKFGQMEISMLGSGKQIVEMGKEYFIGKMEIFTMASGQKIKQMAKVKCIMLKQKQLLKVFGKTES